MCVSSSQVLRLTGLHVADTDDLQPLAAALCARTTAVRVLDLSFSFLGDAAAAALAAAAGSGRSVIERVVLRSTSVGAKGRADLQAAVGGGGGSTSALRAVDCTSNGVSPKGQHYFVTEPRER